MNTQTTTVISGVVFLVVFAILAWSLRRHRERVKDGREREKDGR